jgi:aryl-phospho-beta-D-glucosidase BglC (GH1 family)
MRRLVALFATISLFAVAPAPTSNATTVRPAAEAKPNAIATLSIRVAGNRLVDGRGNRVQLRGVNRSGLEYACIQGWGLFDGPHDLASVRAIKRWHVNAVRLPLNEDCWLGINGVKPEYGGANYRRAVRQFVELLNREGLYVILDLHWSAPGKTPATGQNPMPDSDHSPAFWRGVASVFKSHPAVIFDLFNEPYPDNNQSTRAAWSCLLHGGSCRGVPYRVAGMQKLVTTVRAAGAENVVMVGGVEYANSLDQWLGHRPKDPTRQLAASVHNYNFNACRTAACWQREYAPVAARVPLIAGEIGESGGNGAFVKSYMRWADRRGVSYLGWTWDVWGCSSGPVLISNYTGTPCPGYGATYRAHLLARR